MKCDGQCMKCWNLFPGVCRCTCPASQGLSLFEPIDSVALETTELPVTDDLYHPTGAIAQAERLLAKSAHAKHSFMLYGGATAGVHAMLLYACKRGDTVILPRNAHLSALNICAGLAGIEPVFAAVTQTREGWATVTPEAYQKALDEHPEAKAVLALSSDYFGRLTDIPAIAAIVHARGKLLLCDEAHGAYFNWRRDVQNAGARGADLFVQSAHKTLPSVNAAAWLHAMDGIDGERLRMILRMVQTSSPSFALMRSMDDARAWMDAYGRDACERLMAAMDAFRVRASALGFTDDQKDAPADRLRLVLRAPQGGEWLQRKLQSMNMDVEMYDNDTLFASSPCWTANDGWVCCCMRLKGLPERENRSRVHNSRCACILPCIRNAGFRFPKPCSRVRR